MGNIIGDEYIFKDICNFLATTDPAYKFSTTKLQGTNFSDNKNLIVEYIHCYDFDFQKMIKDQIVNMSVAQLALFKAAVLDIEDLNFNEKQDVAAVPRNISEFINMKKSLGKFKSGELYHAVRYRKIIEKLQGYKQNIITINNCDEMQPVLKDVKRNVCKISLTNGLVMFWGAGLVFIGALVLGFGYFQNESKIKLINERKGQVPSKARLRFENCKFNNAGSYGNAFSQGV